MGARRLFPGAHAIAPRLAAISAHRVDYGVFGGSDTFPFLLRLFSAFLKVGLFSFSASASAVLIDVVVEKKQWLTLDRLRDKISVAALMPGPFHVNLVGLVGYSIKGYAGGILAVVAFVLPGFTLAVLLAVTLSSESLRLFLSENPGFMRGMLISVSGLLLNVILKLGRHSLPTLWYWAAALGLGACLLAIKIPFAYVILGAGLLHLLYIKAKAVSLRE